MPRRKRRFASRVRHYVRSFLAFLFSNVGVIVLVVAYTIAGAFMFQSIESGSEMDRVNMLARDRDSLVLYLWNNVTLKYNPLNETAMKDKISIELFRYQRVVVLAVRRGWDGGRSSRQWSFSSAFLYCLTVITTIGYGHLSPRTGLGKVVTVFYALLGMPLFLLYLTNVGELLARWFKCLYALVCLCRGCPGFTRRRMARLRGQLEVSDPESIERPEAWKHNSSGSYTEEDRFPYLQEIPDQRHSRYRNGNYRNQNTRVYDTYPMEYRNENTRNYNTYPMKSNRTSYRDLYPELYRDSSRNFERITSRSNGAYRQTYDNYRYDQRYSERDRDLIWMRNMTNEEINHYSRQIQRRPQYLRSASMPHPVRGWSSQESSEFSYVTFDAQTITVPLSVCVAIMVGYIFFGSMLFGLWEKWDQLDGAYFCFISLSSIGFGDFVPGERVYTPRIETSFIVCSLYLMLGMALVAMCFNLMQEQVIHYVAGIKRAVKRICRCKR